MLNPFREVNWHPSTLERRRFGRSLVIGFSCVAVALCVVQVARGQSGSIGFPVTLGVAGALLGLVFWAWPRIARPFYVVWYAIACLGGLVFGNAMLVVIYFLIFTPIGLLRRALGMGTFSKNFDGTRASYWLEAKPTTDVESYYRQF